MADTEIEERLDRALFSTSDPVTANDLREIKILLRQFCERMSVKLDAHSDLIINVIEQAIGIANDLCEQHDAMYSPITQVNEIAALREALRKIIAVPIGYHAASKMEGIARAALEASALPGKGGANG